MEHPSNDTKIIPINTRNKVSHCEFDRKSMKTEATTWPEFPNGEKDIVEQILASEERNKSKRAGWWESQSGI